MTVQDAELQEAVLGANSLENQSSWSYDCICLEFTGKACHIYSRFASSAGCSWLSCWRAVVQQVFVTTFSCRWQCHYSGHNSPSALHDAYLYVTFLTSIIYWPNFKKSIWDNHKEGSLLNALLVLVLAKNYPTFRGNRRFITVLTKAQCSSLSQPDKLQFSPSHQNSLNIFYIFCHFLVRKPLKTDLLFSVTLIFRQYWLFSLKISCPFPFP